MPDGVILHHMNRFHWNGFHHCVLFATFLD
jgi:hypothetical protein